MVASSAQVVNLSGVSSATAIGSAQNARTIEIIGEIIAGAVGNVGYFYWDRQDDTPETWTAQSDTPETWTPTTDTSESWSPISDTSENWTEISDNSETWTQVPA
jgi:hypothetical protein